MRSRCTAWSKIWKFAFSAITIPTFTSRCLTDLPDSQEPADEDNPLIDLCSKLIRGLNDKYASQQMGSFLHAPPPSRLQPARKSVDGLGAQARQAARPQQAAARRIRQLPGKDRRSVHAAQSSFRHHARFRHRTAARFGAPHDRHAGASAESGDHRSGKQHCRGRLRNSCSRGWESACRAQRARAWPASTPGETGFDIYTRAVSDVYQDLYGEGSFTGKGIYEVDTVHQVLDRRFPRNALLSHDLIEGAYARAGLASDIEVIEDYPSHYSAYNRRKHRWLRGDWQIAGWLLPHVPDESGTQVRESDLAGLAVEDSRQPAAQPGRAGDLSVLLTGLAGSCRDGFRVAGRCSLIAILVCPCMVPACV